MNRLLAGYTFDFSYEERLQEVAKMRSCTLRYEGVIPVIAREEVYVEIPVDEFLTLTLREDYFGLVELVERLCEIVNEEKNRSLH